MQREEAAALLGLDMPGAQYFVFRLARMAGLERTTDDGKDRWVTREWYLGKELTDGDIQHLIDLVLELQAATAASARMGLDYQVAKTIVKDCGFIFLPEGKRWVARGGKAMKTTSEQSQNIIRRALSGESTNALGRAYQKSNGWIWKVLNDAGCRYDRDAKQWKQEITTVNDDAWNMEQADYEALLTSKRKQSNTNGVAPHVDAATDSTSSLHELGSLEDDIQEALGLLARAEEQRKTDLADIARLTEKYDSERQGKTHLSQELTRLESRVAFLETENKRLMNNLKGEISRGLLRQGMDNLRKVL